MELYSYVHTVLLLGLDVKRIRLVCFDCPECGNMYAIIRVTKAVGAGFFFFEIHTLSGRSARFRRSFADGRNSHQTEMGHPWGRKHMLEPESTRTRFHIYPSAVVFLLHDHEEFLPRPSKLFYALSTLKHEGAVPLLLHCRVNPHFCCQRFLSLHGYEIHNVLYFPSLGPSTSISDVASYLCHAHLRLTGDHPTSKAHPCT